MMKKLTLMWSIKVAIKRDTKHVLWISQIDLYDNKFKQIICMPASGLRMKKLELHQQFSLKALFFLLLSCIKALLVLHHLAKLLLKLLGLFFG